MSRDRELMSLHVEALYTHDDAGRLLRAVARKLGLIAYGSDLSIT